MDTGTQIRMAAFNWLAEETRKRGEVLPRDLLAKGFDFNGTRIPLVSPQGIFKPRQLDLPLSITTTPEGPYEDSLSKDDLLLYKYRGTDPMHRDNKGLRKCMREEIPLVYFHGIVPGKYLAIWPVYIVGDNPDELTFTVAADNQFDIIQSGSMVSEDSSARRSYITSTVKRRLHQQGFRERVLSAYQSQCAFCQLKHSELLDAAHIIPDEEEGEPTVENGLALCKIHHAAFDKYIIGVSPDYQIKVRSDILHEEDGPMLRYGLQQLNDEHLILPRTKKHHPNRDYLDWRFQKFLAAG